MKMNTKKQKYPSLPVFKRGLEQEKREQRIKTDGNHILKTNRQDWTDQQIWQTYVMLIRVEKAFRNFKTGPGLRPNYHQLERRVRPTFLSPF